MTKEYSESAIERAKQEAADWLRDNHDGYPRSWRQEAADTARRGYVMYEYEWDAPPIAGYEALERDGEAVRIGTVTRDDGQERVHFRLK